MLPWITPELNTPLMSDVAVITSAVSVRTAVICMLAGRNGLPGVRKNKYVVLKPTAAVKQASR